MDELKFYYQVVTAKLWLGLIELAKQAIAGE